MFSSSLQTYEKLFFDEKKALIRMAMNMNKQIGTFENKQRIHERETEQIFSFVKRSHKAFFLFHSRGNEVSKQMRHHHHLSCVVLSHYTSENLFSLRFFCVGVGLKFDLNRLLFNFSFFVLPTKEEESRTILRMSCLTKGFQEMRDNQLIIQGSSPRCSHRKYQTTFRFFVFYL